MEQAEALQEVVQEEIIQEPQVDNEEITETEEIEELDTEADNLETEPEYIEVEYEGEKYNLPPELKDAILRQQDYTKKTQEVAEHRRALEQQVIEFQQAAQTQQLNMQGHAQLAALQNQLQQYDGVDWNNWSEQNPQEAQQAFFQYSQLKDATGNLQNQLQQQEAATFQQQQAMTARQLEQGAAELARDIPGWNEELKTKMSEHGKSYGFSDAEIAHIVDPRQIRVLHKAYLYDQMKKEAVNKPNPNLKKAAKVKGKGKVNVDPDKMSTEEWLVWRQKQLK